MLLISLLHSWKWDGFLPIPIHQKRSLCITQPSVHTKKAGIGNMRFAYFNWWPLHKSSPLLPSFSAAGFFFLQVDLVQQFWVILNRLLYSYVWIYIYIHSYYDYTILFVEGFSNHLGYPQDMFCFSGFILGGTGISKSLVNGYCKTSWKPKKYFGIQVEPYGTTCDLWHCGERSRLWATIRWSVLVKRAESGRELWFSSGPFGSRRCLQP